MNSFLITRLLIEALHGEHQHGLMTLMVLSLGIVCELYVATELAETAVRLVVCSLQQSMNVKSTRKGSDHITVEEVASVSADVRFWNVPYMD